MNGQTQLVKKQRRRNSVSSEHLTGSGGQTNVEYVIEFLFQDCNLCTQPQMLQCLFSFLLKDYRISGNK
jgi:hypothetical protein